MRLASTWIRRATARIARVPWLALLIVIALHPLSAAASGGSTGLAGLLREILCGCASCAQDSAPQPAGCCEVEVEREDERERECGSTGGCACSHPDEVPLARVAPIAPVQGAERVWLAALEFALDVPAWVLPADGSARATTTVECRPPPVLLQHATHARRAPATRERLAWLATALI